MSNHNSSLDCPACSEKLKTAHVVLQDWFKTKVKTRYPDAHISWSYRGEEDQEKFFLAGETELHYPNSGHNKTDENGQPQARALDLFQEDPGLPRVTVYNPKFFFSLSEMNKSEGIPILWGGDFKRLGDADHFEMVEDDPEKVS